MRDELNILIAARIKRRREKRLQKEMLGVESELADMRRKLALMEQRLARLEESDAEREDAVRSDLRFWADQVHAPGF